MTVPPQSGNRPNKSTSGAYVHTQVTINEVKSYFLSVIAILCAAVPGTLLAYWSIIALGLSGVSQAIATVFLGLVLSVALFAGLIALGRALKLIK
ncbi:MAG: hypothetical protein ABL931_21930 [Usitatibacteraceae bacterium]